jgi:hypothetical protein
MASLDKITNIYFERTIITVPSQFSNLFLSILLVSCDTTEDGKREVLMRHSVRQSAINNWQSAMTHTPHSSLVHTSNLPYTTDTHTGKIHKILHHSQ